jgi:hypothetical protein
MTNEDVLKLINFISNKDQSGRTLDLLTFNILLPAESTELAKEQRVLYEKTQEVTNAIKHLKVINSSLTINATTGSANLPSDYNYGGQLCYTDTSSYYRKIEILTDAEFNLRMSSVLRTATSKEPICKFVGNYLYFRPITLGSAYFSYLKAPVTPALDYYYDANDQVVFLAVGATHTLTTGEEGSGGEAPPTIVTSSTVEMDWRDEEKLIIRNKILQKISVNLKKAELAQYVQMQKQERILS